MLALAIVLCLAMWAAPSFATSPSEENCQGEFSRVRGKVTCLIEDPVGQSEHSGGKSQTSEEGESSQGTLKNRPHHEESCEGPGGSGENWGGCKK